MCNGVTGISDDKAGITFSYLLPYTRPRQTDTWNTCWTHRCSPSWPLQRRKMLFAELELWHHFAFKSEGTRSQFNANCASHRQNYWTLKKKEERKSSPSQTKWLYAILKRHFFLLLVNWLTKLLLWPNTSAPGLLKKQTKKQWIWKSQFSVNIVNNGVLQPGTVVVCNHEVHWPLCFMFVFFHPFLFKQIRINFSGFERQRRFYFVCCLSVTSTLHWEDGHLLMSLLASLVVK